MKYVKQSFLVKYLKWYNYIGRIKYQDRIYETIVIPKPDPPYITLEILSRERNKSKGTHIISFA